MIVTANDRNHTASQKMYLIDLDNKPFDAVTVKNFPEKKKKKEKSRNSDFLKSACEENFRRKSEAC